MECPRDIEQVTEADTQRMRGKHGGNEAGGLVKAHIICGFGENGKVFTFYPNCKGETWEFSN